MIDKYDPKDGGFRAPMGFATVNTDLRKAWGVGLDANGRIVKGAGNTGIKGVLVLTSNKAVGDIADVMTDGDMVEFPGVAGTNYFAQGTDGELVAGTGALTNTAPVAANSVKVGHTVEATRLNVRVNRA